jgi:hypothetical protein
MTKKFADSYRNRPQENVKYPAFDPAQYIKSVKSGTNNKTKETGGKDIAKSFLFGASRARRQYTTHKNW